MSKNVFWVYFRWGGLHKTKNWNTSGYPIDFFRKYLYANQTTNEEDKTKNFCRF